MGKTAIRTVGKVSLDKPASEQANLHNRWHPDIPFAGTIKNGETAKIECVDWTGGQIGNNDSADDMRNVDLTKIHYLTGPFEVETAEPGDVLLVEIMDVQPFEDHPWGFTGVFDRSNGGGFLDEIYPSAAKAIWDFEGIYCTSRHIPHVKFAGLIHPGILGCAPSQEVLETWNTREAELIAANKLADRHVAMPPEPQNVHAGKANESEEFRKKVGREGARTVPGRPEHGGNCDIKNLSRGSKGYLPVHVPGAKFSVGDLHFSQGDGEISFCGAIEMAGVITINFKVIKNGMRALNMKSPIYVPGPVEPQFGPGRHIYFEGFSVDEHGRQHYMDVTVAYRQTILRCIEYLTQFGYSPYQIYLLLSCAPVQGHVAGIVDIPNACTTLGLPVDIFDFDITPEGILAGKGAKMDMGSCAFETGITMGEVIEPGSRARGSKAGDISFGGGLTYKELSSGEGEVRGGGSGGDGGRKEVQEKHKGTAVANIMGGA
ncbi:acetamidase/Formamidase [Microdochium trichocladiopsis]|uniref:Acetamidase/Formamidase n=1 Tax=Microdochium trichocladiopsis TaxID=1682393 RepID=A0A9P8XUW1_9PEZI|nr:acetamidase/Formamidase [Microdochium trichocladiopsis]KAH7018341.1 acetamidase/Formamidase [Microdochium trichocladiopsis]